MQPETPTGARHPLTTWRGKRRMTLAEFARRIGKTAASVSRYETGHIEPPLQTIRDIERETRGAITVADFYRPPPTPKPARKRRRAQQDAAA